MRESTLTPPCLFSRSSVSSSLPPSLCPAQGPPHTTTSRCHLGWIQWDAAVSWGLGEVGTPPHSLPPPPHMAPSCRYLRAGVSSACTVALASSCLSSSSDRRRLPEEPGGRPLLYQHPLMWSASRFLSGKLSVKSTLRHTQEHTHKVVCIHFNECQKCRFYTLVKCEQSSVQHQVEVGPSQSKLFLRFCSNL